jgi:hypothetical protein
MKKITIGNYVLEPYKTEYGKLCGRVFDIHGHPVNEQGAPVQWSAGQKKFWPIYVEYDSVKELERDFAIWLVNMGELPKSNKWYKIYGEYELHKK